MSSLVAKFLDVAAGLGLRAAIARSIGSIAYRVRKSLGVVDPVHTHRIALSRRMDAAFSGTVRYGPFRTLRLHPQSWWGFTSRGAMLLGIYEKEVLESLQVRPPTHDVFIDVGAADGYYAIGVLTGNLFRTTHCFEASEEGRRVIEASARNNGVRERITIHGTAGQDFLDGIEPDALQRAVLLMDIEGGEFDLLEAENFQRLRKAVVLVELHEWRFADGPQRLRRLLESAGRTHSVTVLTTTSRDLSPFPELETLSDTDRWLLCSEGRDRLMRWLRFDPLARDTLP